MVVVVVDPVVVAGVVVLAVAVFVYRSSSELCCSVCWCVWCGVECVKLLVWCSVCVCVVYVVCVGVV